MDASFSAPRDSGSPIESFSSRQRRFAWSRPLTRVGSVARYLVSTGLGRGRTLGLISFFGIRLSRLGGLGALRVELVMRERSARGAARIGSPFRNQVSTVLSEQGYARKRMSAQKYTMPSV